MKLPPIDVIHRRDELAQDATAFEVAQLHIHRSIAVSLEIIAANIAEDVSQRLKIPKDIIVATKDLLIGNSIVERD